MSSRLSAWVCGMGPSGGLTEFPRLYGIACRCRRLSDQLGVVRAGEAHQAGDVRRAARRRWQRAGGSRLAELGEEPLEAARMEDGEQLRRLRALVPDAVDGAAFRPGGMVWMTSE
jgi:hypothetical protein